MRNPELEMFAFFEKTPVLVCIANREGYFRKINPAVAEKFGYTEAELLSRPIFSLLHPDDLEKTSREREKLLRGRPLLNFENRYITRDGRVIWLEWTSIYMPAQDVVFAIAMDVSERKTLEKDILEKYHRFRSLATHFKNRIEKDRKFLAVELHEELAQLAAAVKLDLDGVLEEMSGIPALVRRRLEHAVAVSDLLVRTIRRISFSISPQVLEESGLEEALRWYCNEFALLTGIPCRFSADYQEPDLSQEVRLDLFRICQEALTNVMYHARASQVEIQLLSRDNEVELCIQDDGVGFDPLARPASSGLMHIRERVASSSGQLSLQSAPGQGTQLRVRIPRP
ncbi:MAG TPA: PAS domain S-box protein [Chitinophagaceae bacterium]|nr:PAS domain S-box protein [Chitinophagaceae bacterium]